MHGVTIKFSRNVIENYSNIKFHENRSSGSRCVACVARRQTDMTKLMVAYRNFTIAPNNFQNHLRYSRTGYRGKLRALCLFTCTVAAVPPPMNA